MIQLQFRLESGVHDRDVRVTFDALERDTATPAERHMANHIRRLFRPLEKKGKRTENHWSVIVELQPKSDEEE